jgi:hypothetical protein
MSWMKSAACAVVFALTSPAIAQSVTGPIAGKPVLVLGNFDLAQFNYVVEEFFITGQATAYLPEGELKPDGHWTVTEGGEAAYATRIVVIRPRDEAKFNGTVVVEWLTTGGGGDSAPDWGLLHREIIRSGYAYVGVTTQRVGIYGTSNPASQAQSLKKGDPVRYETLLHPGDTYAYDIFSQAGRILREGKVLGGLKPKHLLVTCSTVTTGFLTTYVNAIDPLTRVYDGYLIRSRTSTSAKLAPDMPAMAAPVKFRSDMRVPVLGIITETDLLISGYYRARVPDNNRIRVWEVAGTAHGDSYVFSMAFKDSGSLSIAELAQGYAPLYAAMGQQFPKPMNSAPQHHYIAYAALDALNRWVVTGKAPPKGALLDISTDDPPTFRLDRFGNVTGGVRSPWMDVPTARLTGMTELSSGIGRNYGMTEAFGAEQLRRLYPGGRDEYLKKFNVALEKAVADRFILKTDVPEIRSLAAAMYPAHQT